MSLLDLESGKKGAKKIGNSGVLFGLIFFVFCLDLFAREESIGCGMERDTTTFGVV